MDINTLKHWTLSLDDQQIATLMLDKADVSVNVLSNDVMSELEAVVSHLEATPPKGLIVSSNKAAGFLAGADVNEFTGLSEHEEVIAMLQRGQQLFLRIERLKCTTVAVIHGHCLGGGCELALACDYRVADHARECKIGLPEVKLGIHPGYGGAVRLPRLIDSFQALTMMLTGRVLDGKKAAKMGVVDVATNKRHIMAVGHRIASGELKPKRAKTLVSKALAFPVARNIAAALAKKNLQKKANPEHYPAPYRILEFWRTLPAGDEPAYLAEANSVAKLFEGEDSLRAIENLVRIFLLDKELKGRAKSSAFTGKRVHVVGAGVMGGDIAAWCALSGFNVTLQDAKPEFIGPAMARAQKLFAKKLRAPEKVRAAMDRLMPDPSGDGVPSADLIIEAISERLEAKQGLYADLEPRMKKGALLATNTSSIPLEELSANLKAPDRLVGIHFFNPVALMQLVEVVRGTNTSDQSVGEALAFVNAIGKLPIEVKSSPGFLVNRVLMTYVSEAIKLFEEGIAPEAIDKAATDFGMPMGPIELADTVGLDICQAVAGELIEAYGGTDNGILKGMIDQKKLGKKSGHGFYKWEKGKALKDKSADLFYTQDSQDRMSHIMLNESMQCLAEGIVTDSDALDMGMIFGTGFPPFWGGPIELIRRQGQANCQDRLEQLVVGGGDRFTPKPGWAELTIE